jgi:peptidoglycan/LPS O-acetylase OafA/YrhL
MLGRRELEATPSWGRRLLGIEGLRGLAATTVLVGHVQAHLAADVALSHPVSRLLSLTLNGLTLFFTLSGFLLYRPFASAVVGGARFPSVSTYAVNRALRIFPVYVVIVLLVCLVLGVAYTSSVDPGQTAEGAGQHVGFLTDPLTLGLNLLMVQTFFPATIKTGIGPAWSLTVELVFYVVMPALALAAFALARRSRSTTFRVAVALVPAALLLALGVAGSLAQERYLATQPASDRFYLEWGATWHAVFGRSFVAHADLFAFGMVAAVVLVLVERGLVPRRGVVGLRIAAVAVMLAGVYCAERLRLEDTWWALACGALLLVVTLPTTRGTHSLASRGLESVPVRFTGLVSYSLYLWHVPVIWLLDRGGLVLGQTPLGFVGNVVIVFAATLALATLTYFGVERPALAWRRRTGPREPVPAPTSPTAEAAGVTP